MSATFEVKTRARIQAIDIVAEIEQALREQGIRDGLVHIYCPHTTAAITVNEGADPDVMADLLSALERVVPQSGYRHRDGNSDAHVKASLVGCSLTLPLRAGRLALGTWQRVFFCEFDGPRTRQVVVTAFGSLGHDPIPSQRDG